MTGFGFEQKILTSPRAKMGNNVVAVEESQSVEILYRVKLHF